METIIFRECVNIGKQLFFWEASTVTPMIIDLEQQKCSILEIANENEFRGEPFDLITVANRNIYAAERSGAYMCEYSLDTKIVRYIRIDCGCRADGNFALMQSEGDNIFIFDRKHGGTIYDIKSAKVIKIPYPVTVGEVITACRVRESYFLFQKDGNQVLQFDISRRTWNTIKLRTTLTNVIQVVADAQSMYILMESGEIIEWNPEGTWKVIESAKEFYLAERAASRLTLTKDFFIILPSVAEDILIIDRNNLNLQVYKEYPKDFKYLNNTWTKYCGFCENEEGYLFACRTSSYVLKISKDDAKLTWIPSEVDEKTFFDYKQKFPAVIEKPYYLELFIEKVCEDRAEKE